MNRKEYKKLFEDWRFIFENVKEREDAIESDVKVVFPVRIDKDLKDFKDLLEKGDDDGWKATVWSRGSFE